MHVQKIKSDRLLSYLKEKEDYFESVFKEYGLLLKTYIGYHHVIGKDSVRKLDGEAVVVTCESNLSVSSTSSRQSERRIDGDRRVLRPGSEVLARGRHGPVRHPPEDH